MKKIIIKNFNFIPKGSMLVYYSQDITKEINGEPSKFYKNNNIVDIYKDRSIRFKLKDIDKNIGFGDIIEINENIEYNESAPSCSILDSKGSIRNGYIIVFCPDTETIGSDNLNEIKNIFQNEGCSFPEKLYTKGDISYIDKITNLWPLFIVDINIRSLKNSDEVYGYIPFGYSETINSITAEDISPEYLLACHFSGVPLKMWYLKQFPMFDIDDAINKNTNNIKITQNTIISSSPYYSGIAEIYFKSPKTNFNGKCEMGSPPTHESWIFSGKMFE